MRHSQTNASVSTQRRAAAETLPPSNDYGFEPPTHLGSDEFLDLATSFARKDSSSTATKKKNERGAVQAQSKSKSRSRSKSDSIVTSAPRPSSLKAPMPAPLPSAESHSSSKSARGSQPRPLPQPPVAGTVEVASQPKAAPAPIPAPQQTPAPQMMAPPQMDAAPPFMMFNGGAAFDPNALPLPPDIGPAVFGWVRRLALQADLTAADRLLRDAVADLTSSLTVVVIYAGPDGFYSLGPDGEMPKDQTPILAVGKSRRALVGPHSGFIPIATATETIAVIQLVRNARQPAFGEAEFLTMAAIARESAAVLHHLVVQHLQSRHEQQLDQKSLYRPEALQYHRKKGSEGVVTQLSPGWIRRAYPILVISLVIALVAGIVMRVPTYSSGFGMIKYASTPVNAQQSGNIEALYVRSGWMVKAGDQVAKLSSQKEDADYNQYKVEAENAIYTFLADDQDEQAKKSVRSATAALTHAQAAQDQRIIRATADGKVSDVYANLGESVQAGSRLMSIIKPGTMPEVWAYVPATDRPRIKMNMPLQVEVVGFNMKRAKLPIKNISGEAIGANEVRREVGQQLADAVKIAPDTSYVLIKSSFPGDTIKVGKKTYDLHEGMSTKCEVQIDSKPFLATVFPMFEKYFD